ncbi:MAG: type I-E CRISPR-associated endonuclease Cas1e [Rothia sp. (in: high G+C Gram-positive bacteria)]|uniref:type I-E CRISPR-associated endonuclease Cas1e n=1 Tax=Rothia sp. (in: high G+C Gram-positive bacteria) TaxID=1885016 RepID=UPI0026DEBB4C|nr:type I-E CRISPR-associated endonuclease Cas1e [Rothia sp. (in: high G+C Gram-positive bacteria)]MDO5750837.1 type I-E CRISPR-associated endonuclease Cas1e [Rothia sp. (in: high G+C Gram-positive bacteria)]
MIGATPPARKELVRSSERISYLYVEAAKIHRADNAITITDQDGVTHVPAASLSALLLGPGTSITHQAMTVLGDCGTSAIWVGEEGVRYYAHGHSPAKTSHLLSTQADKVSNARKRLSVARTMYEWRFPGEDVSGLSMQQLRGREGARVRRVYRMWSQKTGVEWSKREFDPNNFEGGTAINQALSAAHACLYGIVHAAIVSLGCSPGLGFVHTGNTRSFVYDIADLYKADVSIPAAFETVAALEPGEDVGSKVRRAVRDRIREQKIMVRIVEDIKRLLDREEFDENDASDGDLMLWDGKGTVSARINHGSFHDSQTDSE